MKLKYLFALVVTINSLASFGQKKVLDHNAYNDWRRLSANQISEYGEVVTFEINPYKGDGYLYIYQPNSIVTDSILRGKNAEISYDEKFVIFQLIPGYDTLRNCELNNVDKKKWPKDTLAVYFLENDSIVKFGDVKSHSLAEKSSWFAYLENDNEIKATEGKSKKKKKKKKEKDEPKSEGKVLHVINYSLGKDIIEKNVVDYHFSKYGKFLVYTTNLGDSTRIHYLDLSNDSKIDGSNYTSIKAIKSNELETKIAYLASLDTTKTKVYDLYLYDFNTNVTIKLVDTLSNFLPDGKTVSENQPLIFSNDNAHLFFGLAEIPKEAPKDSLLESEKAVFDLWHYQDKRLQPQQLKELKRDETRTDLYAYSLDNLNFVSISNDTLTSYVSNRTEGNWVLASSNERYSLAYQWDMSGKEDIYLVNLKNGDKRLLKEAVRYYAPLSAKADQFVYYDYDQKEFYALGINDGVEWCLTCGGKNVNWAEDVNGMSADAYPFGVFGWNKAGNEIYIKSQYDLFSYNFDNKRFSCVTEFKGAKDSVEYQPRKWNYDSTFVSLENTYFMGMDLKTKDSKMLMYRDGDFVDTLSFHGKMSVDFKRAPQGDVYMFRDQNVEEYPELMVSHAGLGQFHQCSNTNPQQKEYNWATVELIEWESYDGTRLEGLLYKPEDFDSTKKYPLLVYFYELYSDKLHAYYAPKPTASIIYPTEYASAGYVVFIPDVRYKIGHPAQSAYDCIMSGTDKVLELLPNVDSTRMGLQGQSWGGYQTAQLITMTDRYAAAMAGAPVSNMFSAYGGIRWGSGVNRQFQYEKTQSRIGKTIWEVPELYIENSPIFQLPKVETPLLIMHNDGDGAVPWYQGIELYTGLRRLQRPCWLLNYNNDDHNLMKEANRLDLSIRMRQFFDHYLQGKPAPSWLLNGIPAIKKGKESGYEVD